MGKLKMRRDNRGRMTLPTLRPPGTPTPCHKCPKIPDGAHPEPASARELDDRGWRIYRHYLECKAVGSFPNDPHVRRHAGIIRQVEDDYYLGGTHELSDRIDSLFKLIVTMIRR